MEDAIMKKLGTAAIVLTVIFIVFLFTGATMAIAGGVDLFVSCLDEFEGGFDGFDGITIPSVPERVERSAFAARCSLADVEQIVLLKGSACSMNIVAGDTDELLIEVRGTFSAKYLDRYSIDNGEVFDAEMQDGPVSASVEDGVLSIDYDHDDSIGTKAEVTVTLPRDWNGSICFDDSAAALKAEGLELQAVYISECAGMIEIEDSSIGLVEITECVSSISIDGAIGSFNVSQCLGNVEIESEFPLEDSCEISDNLGNIEISICGKVTVEDSGNLGEVRIDGETHSGGTLLIIKNNLGRVDVEIE